MTQCPTECHLTPLSIEDTGEISHGHEKPSALTQPWHWPHQHCPLCGPLPWGWSPACADRYAWVRMRTWGGEAEGASESY